MTEQQPDNDAAADAAGKDAAAPFSVGKALREARAQQNLSVDEVSGRIKFAPRQVEALEADDFAHLPATTFLRGFVRSYARLLQIDPAPLLAALPRAPEQSASPQTKALTDVPFPDIYTERKQNIIWLAAALVVAVAVALSAWLFSARPKERSAPQTTLSSVRSTTVETLALPQAVPISAVPEAGSDAVSAPPDTGSAAPIQGAEVSEAEVKKAAAPQTAALPVQPVAAPPARPVANAASASGPAAIRVTFDADSWVEIADKSGKILLSQLGHAGEQQNIDGSPPFTLTIGYFKAVHLYYKGRAVDLAPHAKAEVAHLTLE